MSTFVWNISVIKEDRIGFRTALATCMAALCVAVMIMFILVGGPN